MGGQTFANTTLQAIPLEIVHEIREMFHDVTVPLRLGNKTEYHDIDFITCNEHEIIKVFHDKNIKIVDMKDIPLKESFQTYSYHLLIEYEKTLLQIDILRPFNARSTAITQAFFSYGFANVFFKKLVPIANKDFKLSYLGLLCHNNSLDIDTGEVYRLDPNTRLVTDVYFLFAMMDLDYDRFLRGFKDEYELLDFLKSSKYFSQIKLNVNASKFRHDLKRLPGLAKLHSEGLL